VINAIKFSIEEIEASDQYFDHTTILKTAAMDDLEGRRDVRPDQRVDQIMRLRKIIEERASRKFFEEQAQSNRPVVLRANDFSS
jgi:hypothetical protein